LYGLLDWQHGGSIINLTKFLYDLGSNTVDYADPITVGGGNVHDGRKPPEALAQANGDLCRGRVLHEAS